MIHPTPDTKPLKLAIHSKQSSVLDDFLLESNLIESEVSAQAYRDAHKAWKYAAKLDRVSITELLGIHKLLMQNLRPDIAGKIRDCAVSIGGQIKHYHGANVIYSELQDVLGVMSGTKANFDEGKEELAAKHCHVMFEDIHPFEDGNGRVGRILYNWQRLKLGLPIHVIHADWHEKGDTGEQASYYRWFRK